MPIFEIENYTRYNTDDLLAVLDAIEESVAKAALPVKAATIYTRRNGSYRPGVLVFRDYNPTSLSMEGSFVKSYGRTYAANDQVGIVPPEKVFASPLEALAAVEKEQVKLPMPALSQLVQRLSSFYDLTGSFNVWEQLWFAATKAVLESSGGVRIESEPDRVRTKGDRRRDQIQMLKGKLSDSHYALAENQCAIGRTKSVMAGLEKNRRRAQRLKLPGAAKDMGEALDYLSDALERLEKAAVITGRLLNLEDEVKHG